MARTVVHIFFQNVYLEFVAGHLILLELQFSSIISHAFLQIDSV
jgi:hypothetical protein